MPDTLKKHQIERFAIDSTSIKSIGYQDGICVTEFSSGHLYAHPMSEAQFTAYAQSPSKGRYFNTEIKGKFNGEKLTSRCGKCGSEPEIVGEPCSDCGATILPMDSVHKEQR